MPDTAVLDDTVDAYWGDDRATRLVAQAQQYAALTATQARWACTLDDPRYAAWCQQRAARAAENARMMRDLAAPGG